MNLSKQGVNEPFQAYRAGHREISRDLTQHKSRIFSGPKSEVMKKHKKNYAI